MDITRDQLLSLPAIEFNDLLRCVDEETEDLLHYLLHALVDDVEIPDDLIPISLRADIIELPSMLDIYDDE
jgi:hypothetical protein